jgi:hypothetical protein
VKLKNIWRTLKRFNTHASGIPKGEKRENEKKQHLKEY